MSHAETLPDHWTDNRRPVIRRKQVLAQCQNSYCGDYREKYRETDQAINFCRKCGHALYWGLNAISEAKKAAQELKDG